MDEQMRRAIEESKRMAELEKKRRAEANADSALQAAIEASKREEEQRTRELARQEEQRLAAQRARAQQQGGGGQQQLSEEEQLRRAIEASKLDAESKSSQSRAEAEALRLAIERSKQTAKEEEERRKQEEQELNFALQLSAALYQASNVSRQMRDQKQTVQGQVQKEYVVPVLPGKLEVKIEEASDLPNMKSGSYRMNPYVVLRVMCIAPIGVLELTLHKGEGLRNTQLLGVQDPYVIVTLDGKRKATTKVHYDAGRKPVWEETKEIEMTGREKDSSIELQIWNKNMMSDERIGYAFLDVADILKPEKKKWIRVARKKAKGYMSGLDGRIQVSWSFRSKGAPGFKQLKVIESEKAYIGGTDPKWNKIISVPELMSNTYVQATIRDKRTFGSDTILAISNVISVQGAIHQNFFSKGNNKWYVLQPSSATRSKCLRGTAGKIKLDIKFKDEEHPNGIEPVEVMPQAEPLVNVSAGPGIGGSGGEVVQGEVVVGSVHPSEGVVVEAKIL